MAAQALAYQIYGVAKMVGLQLSACLLLNLLHLTNTSMHKCPYKYTAEMPIQSICQYIPL